MRRLQWTNAVFELAATLLGAALLCLALSAGAREARFAAAEPPPATGLYLLESWHEGERAFRWTSARATLNVPNPGGPTLITMQLAGGSRPVTAQIAGAVHRALPIEPTPRRFIMLLPSQPGEHIRIQIDVPPLRPVGEPRELGVQLGEVVVRSAGGLPHVVFLAMLLSSLSLYGLVRTLAPAPVSIGAGVAIPGALLAWHLLAGWTSGHFVPLVTSVVFIAVVILTWWWLLPAAGQHWRTAAPIRVGHTTALAGAGFAFYVMLGLWNQRVVHPQLAFDLAIYLEAGRTILAGASPYALFEQGGIGTSFIYPPATLPFFATLAALESPAVAPIWVGANLLGFLLAFLAIALVLPKAAFRSNLVVLILLGFSSGPVLESLAIGQINGLMLLGLALFILGHVNRRYVWIGDIGLAAVILIKLTPVILVLWPLVHGDRARLLRIGSALLALSLPSLLLFGLSPWLEFVALVPELLHGVPGNPYNQALVGVFTRMTTPGSGAAAVAVLIVRSVSLALLGGWALVAWRGRNGDPRPVLACGVAVLTVASSLIWYHHLAFLAIPLAWLGLSDHRRWGDRIGALVALALIQVTRLVEVGLGAPPWTVVLGYMISVILLTYPYVVLRQAHGSIHSEPHMKKR